MKVLSGKPGDQVKDQVPRRILASFWSRGRASWGEEVECGILATGFKEGTPVKFSLFEIEDGGDTPLKEVDGKIEKGRAKAKYKIDLEDPDVKPGDTYKIYFIAKIDEIESRKDKCPLLLVDTDPFTFSD